MPTILVVDDDADPCRNRADLFGDRGYCVYSAEGGGSALAQAPRQAYDVGSLDLWMARDEGNATRAQQTARAASACERQRTGHWPTSVDPAILHKSGGSSIRIVLRKAAP
jgi:CheY-like chemotaxis protein